MKLLSRQAAAHIKAVLTLVLPGFVSGCVVIPIPRMGREIKAEFKGYQLFQDLSGCWRQEQQIRFA